MISTSRERPRARREPPLRALALGALLWAAALPGLAEEAAGPDVEAVAREALLLIQEGKTAESLTLLERTLEEARAAGAPGRDRALLHTRLAIAYYYRRDLAEIDRHADLAIALAKDDPDAPRVYADALNVKGIHLSETGQTEAYLEIGLEELEVRRKLPIAESQLAVPLISIALAHAELGDFREAERYLLEALEYSSRYEPDSHRQGVIQTNLSYVYGLRKEYRSAAEMAAKAVQDGRRTAPDSVILAVRLENLGSLQQALGAHDEARATLEEALAIQRRLIPGSVDEARSLHSLAQVAESTGRLADAEARYRAAVKIVDERMPDYLPGVQPIRSLGKLLVVRGELDEAEALLRRALAVSAAHPNSGEQAESLHAIALLEEARGDRDAALATMSAAVDALETQYDLLGGTVLTVASFSSAFEPLYKDLGRLLIGRGENEAAIALLESYRERALLDRIEVNRLLERSGPGERLAADIEELRRKARELSETTAEPRENGTRDDLPLKLADLRQRRRELFAEAVRADPRLAELLPPAAEFSVAGLGLRPDQRVLYFHLDRHGSDLLVISGGRIRRYPLPSGDRIDALVRRYRLLLQTPHSDLEAVHALGRRLFDVLVAPAGDELEGAGEVVIAAEGSLLLLPFATLRDPRGRYLVETVRVRQVGTLARLAAARRPVAAGHTAYTGFAYESGGDVVAIMSQRNVGRLRFVIGEVERAARMFEPRSIAYTGPAATEASAKRVDRTSVLHFATHAVVDSLEPMRSYIDLAVDRGQDGRLELWEIMEEMQLDTDLVVLSACDTAVGPVFAGEGVLGLAKGFAFAGADAVLASLWPVADESTSRLIEVFFHELAQGESRAEALRRAKLSLVTGSSPLDGTLDRWLKRWLGDDDFSHPYYWAPFVLNGAG